MRPFVILLGILLFVLLLWGLANLVAESRERSAEAAFPPLGKFVEVEGLRIHAIVEGSGPDLVLIHGSSGHARDFKVSFIDLVKDRYRVIALDRPGLGHSDALPKGAEGIHDQARVLQKAAAKFGAKAPIVLGQSYGGAVALAWALDLPDTLSALVTVSGPSHPWVGPLDTYYKIVSHPLGQIFAPAVIAAIYSDRQVKSGLETVFEPQDVPQIYADTFGVPLTLTRKRIRVNARHRAILKNEIITMARRYQDIAVPFEIVHGDADIIVYWGIHARAMLLDNDLANFEKLDGIGHMPHHVAPMAVVDAIDRAYQRSLD